MQIHLRVSSGIAGKLGQARLALDVAGDATPTDVLAHLSAAYPDAADLLARAVVMADGRHVDLHDALQPGQELALLIPIAGGVAAGWHCGSPLTLRHPARMKLA